MKIQVYKETKEDWYPSYQLGDTNLVRVFFCDLKGCGDAAFRVAVWGEDDCGMEFDHWDESYVEFKFKEVLDMEYVNRDELIKLGFKSA